MISICSKDSFVNSDSILLSFSPFIPLNETPGMTVVFPGLFHRFSACTAAFACSEQANVFPAILLAGRDFPQGLLLLPLDFLHTVRQAGVPLLPHLVPVQTTKISPQFYIGPVQGTQRLNNLGHQGLRPFSRQSRSVSSNTQKTVLPNKSFSRAVLLVSL